MFDPETNIQDNSEINYAEKESDRMSTINIANLDTSTQKEIQNIVNAEVLEESIKYWAGINVLGGGFNPMLLAGKSSVLEMAENRDPRVINALKEKGLNDSNNATEMINILSAQENEKEQKIRTLERNVIEELGANRIRLHFDESMTHLSIIENLFDDEGDVKESEIDTEEYVGFMDLVKYVEELEKNGIKVEITLGPGVSHPELYAGNRYMYSASEYRLPVDEADKKVWERYCKGIARHFPNTDLTVWIEPNFKAFVNTGRDGNKYAETVISAANAVKTTDPNRKVGLNMLFLDQSFAFQTLKQIREEGYLPSEIVEYVSFNSYRFRAPEAPTWTEGSAKFILHEQPKDELSSKYYDTYEEEVNSFRQKLKEYGITDIRVGESGYEGDDYSPHQNTVCNLRSWIIDRYLYIKETPWRAIQKTGSKSNRGLVSEDGIPTENFYAYRNFNQIFTSEVKPLGEIRDPEDRRVLCKIFKNRQTGEDIMVLWVAQEYSSQKEIYKKKVFIKIPSELTFTKISKLWNKEVEKENVSTTVLNNQGIVVTEDPVILIGKFGIKN